MKKELILGAILIGILVFWAISIGFDITQAGDIQPVLSNQATITIIGWVLTVWLVGFLLVAFWAIYRLDDPAVQNLKKRITIRAVIPRYFVLALAPFSFGLGFALLTGKVNWGGWLMCLSFPTLLILTWIAIRHSKRG